MSTDSQHLLSGLQFKAELLETRTVTITITAPRLNIANCCTVLTKMTKVLDRGSNSLAQPGDQTTFTISGNPHILSYTRLSQVIKHCRPNTIDH